MYYGVREFGMTAMMNGIALHGGLIPYGGTFLVFSDYARNAVRMAALMKQRVIHVFTHDSIGLGEDGPTHQPIEHLCEPARSSRTWASGGPATRSRPRWPGRGARAPRRPDRAVLTRQNLPQQPRTAEQLEAIAAAATC